MLATPLRRRRAPPALRAAAPRPDRQQPSSSIHSARIAHPPPICPSIAVNKDTSAHRHQRRSQHSATATATTRSPASPNGLAALGDPRAATLQASNAASPRSRDHVRSNRCNACPAAAAAAPEEEPPPPEAPAAAAAPPPPEAPAAGAAQALRSDPGSVIRNIALKVHRKHMDRARVSNRRPRGPPVPSIM